MDVPPRKYGVDPAESRISGESNPICLLLVEAISNASTTVIRRSRISTMYRMGGPITFCQRRDGGGPVIQFQEVLLYNYMLTVPPRLEPVVY